MYWSVVSVSFAGVSFNRMHTKWICIMFYHQNSLSCTNTVANIKTNRVIKHTDILKYKLTQINF